MSDTLKLRCQCGALRGHATGVSPKTGSRLVCMCDDCQTFAHHLGQAERALDASGGIEVFQLTPAQVHLSEGLENLRCGRLSPKGLMRWYAGCCNSPVANTLPNPKVPFVGIPHTFHDHSDRGGDAASLLGPVRARIQGRYGKKPLPAGSHPTAPKGVLARSGWLLLTAFVSGKGRPSPFFVEGSDRPVVEPTILTLDERKSARAAAGF